MYAAENKLDCFIRKHVLTVKASHVLMLNRHQNKFHSMISKMTSIIAVGIIYLHRRGERRRRTRRQIIRKARKRRRKIRT